jgi:hypothetical protein
MENLTNPQQEEVKNINVEENNVGENIEQEEILEDVSVLVQNYTKMTAEELFTEMKKLYEASNFEQLKAKASLIRNSFNTLTEGKNEAMEVEFLKLYEAYKEKRQKNIEEQEKIKQENLVKKQSILEDLRVLIDSDGSLKDIYDAFNVIQERWKEIGQVPRNEMNSLWEHYHFLIEKFYDKVKINKELRDLDMKKNLEAKIELCENVEALMLENSINKSFHTLQEIREKWKEIGPVPSDKKDEIWERFKTASDKINQRRKEYYDQKFAEMELNLKAKTEVCEKAEEILKKELTLVKDWTEATNEVNESLILWRSIGSISKKDNDLLWARFKASVDTFFARKKKAFSKMKEEHQQHFNEKIELCVKAETIALRNDWKKATGEILELQKQWKAIGYIPKEKADKLWERFRKACDEFFAKKAESFAQYRVSEEENVAKKMALIEEVKAFEFTDDKVFNLNNIKEFQRRWSEIGFISTETRQQLQKEFREVIDAHFDKLKISTKEFELNSFKERITSSGDSGLSNEKRTMQEQIRKLQNELKVWENNLGFFAKSKSADILRIEYEKKLGKIRQQIAFLQTKLKIANSEKSQQNNKKDTITNQA